MIGHVARLVRPPTGGLELVQENLLVEGDDDLHVAEDEVSLVSHARVAGGHPVLVSSEDTLQVSYVLVFSLDQLRHDLLVSEMM